jgi:hypothetical protein
MKLEIECGRLAFQFNDEVYRIGYMASRLSPQNLDQGLTVLDVLARLFLNPLNIRIKG